jgi:hypothetical protein
VPRGIVKRNPHAGVAVDPKDVDDAADE